MRAAVYEKYGPPEVVHIAEVRTPVAKDNEVLIRIRAATVSSADWRARSLTVPRGFGPMARLVFGITRPRRPILGTDLAGQVAAVGSSVTRWHVGDTVIAYPGLKMGSHAQYIAMPEDGLIAQKPANLPFEDAVSLLFGGVAALDFYRRGKLQAGETVVVNGASSAVGQAAVQLARHFGASHVTAVTSARNLDLVRMLGADRVVDYNGEDFTANGAKYDAIVDTAGTVPWSRAKGALTPEGRALLVLGSPGDTMRASLSGGKKIVAGTGKILPEDVRLLGELAAAGKLKPVIDSVYPLEEIVAAHARTDSGRKRGSVVVRIT